MKDQINILLILNVAILIGVAFLILRNFAASPKADWLPSKRKVAKEWLIMIAVFITAHTVAFQSASQSVKFEDMWFVFVGIYGVRSIFWAVASLKSQPNETK